MTSSTERTQPAADGTVPLGLPGLRGAFDEHRPPAPELIGDCVHCGFCLPTCPTYNLWGGRWTRPAAGSTS
jgi:glycolate oxidase iron-sulfur subunit